MRHEFASEWAAFKRPIVSSGAKANLKFSLAKQHFPYRMEKIATNAKRLHLFLAGGASGDVELLRNGASLGTTQIVSGTAFDKSSFLSTGDFELRFDSNDIDNLWAVIDWSQEGVA